ncbi:MAG: hypothetical protein QNL33_19065 [Akkermansiaceae bacterium]|jgi:hypothetical protein
MNPNHPNSKLPDFDSELENDAIWDVLAEATPGEAPPRFLQDTLRRARLEPAARPGWRSLGIRGIWTASLTTLGTAAAVVALIISLPSDPTPVEQTTSTQTTAPTQWLELEDALASEVLTEAAENPAMFSDQEIVALLY